MARFMQRSPSTPVSEKHRLEMKYTNSRHNLLLVIIFSAINMLLTLFNANMYFLFSASVPLNFTTLGMYYCGKMPAEYYTPGDEAYFLNTSFLIIMIVLSVIVLALYFLSWLLSQKHKVGWLIFALVFFALDTLYMFYSYGISVDMIIDLVFHAWVLYRLAAGIHAHFKLKNLPPEDECVFAPVNEAPSYAPSAEAPAENVGASVPDSSTPVQENSDVSAEQADDKSGEDDNKTAE